MDVKWRNFLLSLGILGLDTWAIVWSVAEENSKHDSILVFWAMILCFLLWPVLCGVTINMIFKLLTGKRMERLGWVNWIKSKFQILAHFFHLVFGMMIREWARVGFPLGEDFLRLCLVFLLLLGVNMLWLCNVWDFSKSRVIVNIAMILAGIFIGWPQISALHSL